MARHVLSGVATDDPDHIVKDGVIDGVIRMCRAAWIHRGAVPAGLRVELARAFDERERTFEILTDEPIDEHA